MKKTSRKNESRKADLGGFRTVVLTNGKEYVEQANYCFGIVILTADKAKATRMFLKDAVDAIKDINKYGVHRLWAEEVVHG